MRFTGSVKRSESFMIMDKTRSFILLNILLLIYSLSGVFSKLASRQSFFSLRFFLYYGMIIFLLGIYAVSWQQIIKNLPLSTAFANKAVTVLWGLIWGVLFFGERVTLSKLAGILMIICGIVIYALSDRDTEGNRG